MPKHLFVLFVLIILIDINTFSQINNKNEKLKVGIYKTEKEAATNSPSVTADFRCTPLKGMIEPNDSIGFCDCIQLDDSTINRKRIFGFSNGKDIYVRIIEYEKTGLITTLLDPFFYHRFYKMDYIGKFSFIRIKPAKRMKVSTVEGKTVKDDVSNMQKDPLFTIDDVWYFDKKYVLRKATEQAFYFVLKDDKDLYKEFGAERHKNAALYVKYLIILNERYK